LHPLARFKTALIGIQYRKNNCVKYAHVHSNGSDREERDKVTVFSLLTCIEECTFYLSQDVTVYVHKRSLSKGM